MSAKVFLVGAGPGDPELITWKGRRLIEAADAILYDNLAPRALLALAPDGCELVYVGKKRAVLINYPEQDELYVSDTGGHVVNVFNKSGDYIRTIGSRGIEPGRFNFPTHLWVDKSGKLYVSDTLNYRVQVFSSQGQFLNMFGEHGDRPGNFAHPCGIATDSFGNIYVTDRQFENVQIFNQQGRILMAFGQEGKQAGQFWLPAGIFVGHSRLSVNPGKFLRQMGKLIG